MASTPPVSKRIPIYLAVTGPQSVKAAARFADGFITFFETTWIKYCTRQLQKKAEKQVTDEQLKQSIDIITSVEDCMKRIEEYLKSGFTKVYIHSTSPDETYFVRSFSKKVLPYFSER